MILIGLAGYDCPEAAVDMNAIQKLDANKNSARITSPFRCEFFVRHLHGSRAMPDF